MQERGQTMLEYIEKERALSIVVQTRKSFESTMGKDTDFLSSLNLCGCINATMIIEDSLSDLPTADVVPVVHGVPVRKNRPRKYEWYEEVKTENGEILYRKHVYVDETNWAEYCPACGKRLCSRFKSYCPSCGAMMDLEG